MNQLSLNTESDQFKKKYKSLKNNTIKKANQRNTSTTTSSTRSNLGIGIKKQETKYRNGNAKIFVRKDLILGFGS